MFLHTKRRGAALLFSIGILALLSVFAISFISLARLERKSSANYILNIRAELLAKGGSAAGLAALRNILRPLDIGEQRYCETAFSNPNGPWCYRGLYQNPLSTGNGIPLTVAMSLPKSPVSTISFQVENRQSIVPNILPISGVLGGTDIAGGDVYGLKVLDSQGMININQPITDEYKAMLITLGDEICKENTFLRTQILNYHKIPVSLVNDWIPIPISNPFSSAKVDKLVAIRKQLPDQSFKSKNQLASSGIWTENEFKIIKDYITCWGDFNQVIKGPPKDTIPFAYPAANFHARVTNPTESVARFPVNINTAPRAVLVAVMANCGAWGWQYLEDRTDLINYGNVQYPAQISLVPYTCDVATANKLADAIIAWRTGNPQNSGRTLQAGRFRGWRDVYDCFLDNLLSRNIDVTDKNNKDVQAVVATLVSTNPYALNLGWNPDQTLLYWDDAVINSFQALAINADKASAIINTEFCFSTNIYEIESLGRIYGENFSVDAEADIHSVIRIGDTILLKNEFDLVTSVTKSWNVITNDMITGQWPSNLEAFPQKYSISPLANLSGWIQPQFYPPISSFDEYKFNSLTPYPLPNITNLVDDQPSCTPPDGYLQLRNYGRNGDQHSAKELDFDVTGAKDSNPKWNEDELLDEGTVSFWIKLPLDVNLEGANESLLYYIRRFQNSDFQDTSDGLRADHVGCATRLERYGSHLFCSRFFWGRGGDADAAAPPPHSDWVNQGFFAGVDIDLNDMRFNYLWKPGTWHHIMVSWKVMALQIWIDEQRPIKAIPAYFTAGKQSELYQVDGWWNQGFATDVKDTTFTLDLGSQINIPRFKLASFKDPAECKRFIVLGGYDASNDNLPQSYSLERGLKSQNGFQLTGSKSIRWSNATYADFRFSPEGNTDYNPISLPFRWQANGSNGLIFTQNLQFDLTNRLPLSAAQDLLPSNLRGYITWFALFANSPGDEISLLVQNTEINKQPISISSASGPLATKQDANRWSGGIPFSNFFFKKGDTTTAVLTLNARIQFNSFDPASAPFAFMGFQIQYQLTTPIILEGSLSLN